MLTSARAVSSPHAFSQSSALVRETQELTGSPFPHLSLLKSTTERVLSVSSSISASVHTQPTRFSTPGGVHARTSSRSRVQFIRVQLKGIWKRRGSERGWSIFKSARISWRARATYVLPLKTRYSTSDSVSENAWKNVSPDYWKLSRNICERFKGFPVSNTE